MPAITPCLHLRRAALSLLAAGLALAVALPAAGADWPQYRGPGRDARSPETGLDFAWEADGPEELWRVSLGDGYSSIAVADGRVYTLFGSGDDEYALCLDAATGKELWRFRLDRNRSDRMGDGPRSTPTVDGETVYVLGALGKLYALDVGTGESRWRVDLVGELGGKVPQWGISTSPLVDGRRLLLDLGGGRGRSVAALDKVTGELLWAAASDKPGYSAPLIIEVGGLRQAVFFTGSQLVAVSPADGRELWQLPWKTSYDVNAAMPLFIPPDKLFVSSGYDVGAAVLRIHTDGETARVEEIWRSRVMKNQFSSSVLVGGNIYGFDNKTFKCVDAATGEERWRYRGLGQGSLLYADGHLLVFGERGQLALVEATPEAYRKKAQTRVFDAKTWNPPALADGRLFLRSEGEMVALDLRR